MNAYEIEAIESALLLAFLRGVEFGKSGRVAEYGQTLTQDACDAMDQLTGKNTVALILGLAIACAERAKHA